MASNLWRRLIIIIMKMIDAVDRRIDGIVPIAWCLLKLNGWQPGELASALGPRWIHVELMMLGWRFMMVDLGTG
jgi:hypothetical protein